MNEISRATQTNKSAKTRGNPPPGGRLHPGNTPKGLSSIAQGCPVFRATLGEDAKQSTTLKGLHNARKLLTMQRVGGCKAVHNPEGVAQVVATLSNPFTSLKRLPRNSHLVTGQNTCLYLRATSY